MEKLLTVEQMADYLQVKPSTIYQWTHQRFIPHVKLGNRIRFRVSKVEKWLEERSITGRLARRVDVL